MGLWRFPKIEKYLIHKITTCALNEQTKIKEWHSYSRKLKINKNPTVTDGLIKPWNKWFKIHGENGNFTKYLKTEQIKCHIKNVLKKIETEFMCNMWRNCTYKQR